MHLPDRSGLLRFLLTLLFALGSRPALAQSPVKILFLGDSLTAGYGVDKDENFPALVEKELKAKGHAVEVVNGGISGSTTASGESRLRWHLRSKAKPHILVLALGANDGLRGQDLEASKKNLITTIRLAKDQGLRVLLAGMMIPPNYGKEYTSRFQALFPEIAEKEKVPLIPFLLEGVAGEADLNLPDGIHPNAKGYRVVAQTVLKHLLPLIESVGGQASAKGTK